MRKPVNLEKYHAWAQTALPGDFRDVKVERLYATNITQIYNAVVEHDFFVGFSREASKWEAEYKGRTRSELLLGGLDLKLATKPYPSVVEKTFRKNVLWNRGFPREPRDGWINHTNIYARLNDLVRGTLVCRFIDGPEFVTEQIKNYATTSGIPCRSYSQEREDGYYAYHVYVPIDAKVFDLNWNVEDVSVEVEIQLTTQLQDVLRTLTHRFYEETRVAVEEDNGKWKWEFASSRFKVSYLSHTLHLLESVILEARERVLGSGSGHHDVDQNHG